MRKTAEGRRWLHRTPLPGIASHYFLVRRWRWWYRLFNRVSLWTTHRLLARLLGPSWRRHEVILLSRESLHLVTALRERDTGVLR